LEDQERDVIVHGETGLRVNVVGLEAGQYEPTAGEIHISERRMGNGWPLTEGWTMEELGIISGAVLWYGRYLNYPEMQVSEEDPRMQVKLKQV
jgi:hypothetical protein